MRGNVTINQHEASALYGLKVVEFAHVVAAPLAANLLADFGAEVVKVEAPGLGDPARQMGPHKDGVYLWWKVSARNKKSVTIDLRTTEGQDVAHKLVAWADVVIVSLRSSTLKKWRLDWETLRSVNPKVIVLQISGYGANTSLRDAPGFGKVGEARSGVAFITGEPDGPPMLAGFSHGDATTGLMGAFGILLALARRERDAEFCGEWIDLALFEPLFRLVEWQVIVHDQLGMVPKRSGNQLPVAPAAVINVYRTRDEDWLVITSGTPGSVRSVARLLSEPDDDYLTAEQQKINASRLDKLLAEWVAERTAEECLTTLREQDVIASRIFDVRDILDDPIYAERSDILCVPDPELGDVRMTGVVPRLANHGGSVRRPAPTLGQDTKLVLTDYLDMTDEEIGALKSAGII
jgi:crotonobetainyl-CoA:carnitine CoA-transferase CaiB-like acyl-CoA transferase